MPVSPVLSMTELPHLPSIIANTKFDEKGFVQSEQGLLVPAYVASAKGFSEEGMVWLNWFYSQLMDRKVFALCPFAACAEYLDFTKINSSTPQDEVFAFWDSFNKIVGPVNYKTLMPRSKLLVAILEGVPLDEGVCAEISYFAPKYGPVIGIRTDFRPAENIAAPINPAVRYFIDQGPYKGKLYLGNNAYMDAFEGIEKLASEMIAGSVKK